MLPHILDGYLPAFIIVIITTLFCYYLHCHGNKKPPLKTHSEPTICPVSEAYHWEDHHPQLILTYKPTYKMSLHLRKLQPDDLFVIESTYKEHTLLRAKLFEETRLFGCLENDLNALNGLREWYKKLVHFFLAKYPKYFKIEGDFISNLILNTKLFRSTAGKGSYKLL